MAAVRRIEPRAPLRGPGSRSSRSGASRSCARSGASWRSTSSRSGPGETLAIVGPNGAGKSTLLLALAGLLRPDRGSIVVEGAPGDPRPGPRLPAADRARAARAAAAVDVGLRERRRGPALPGCRRSRDARAGRSLAGAAGDLPPAGPSGQPALERRGAADEPRPRPGAGSAAAPARRAVRGARQHDPRAAPRRLRAAPRRDPHDAGARDAPPARGGPAGRPPRRPARRAHPPVRRPGAGDGVPGRRGRGGDRADGGAGPRARRGVARTGWWSWTREPGRAGTSRAGPGASWTRRTRPGSRGARRRRRGTYPQRHRRFRRDGRPRRPDASGGAHDERGGADGAPRRAALEVRDGVRQQRDDPPGRPDRRHDRRRDVRRVVLPALPRRQGPRRVPPPARDARRGGSPGSRQRPRARDRPPDRRPALHRHPLQRDRALAAHRRLRRIRGRRLLGPGARRWPASTRSS